MINKKAKNYRQKIWDCLPCRITAIIAGILLGLFLVTVILVDPALNYFVKPKILQSVNSNKNLYLKIEDFSYNIFGNSISTYNVELNNYTESGKITATIPEIYSSGVPWFNFIFGRKGLDLNKITIKNPVIFIEENPDSSKDSSGDSSNKSEEFLSRKIFEDLPEQINPFAIDELEIVNGSLIREVKNEKKIRTDSLKNIQMIISSIFLSPVLKDSNNLKYAKSILLNIGEVHSKLDEIGYDVRIGKINISSADSSLEISSLTYKSFLPVEDYFARRKYRSDRNDISLPGITISGLKMSEFFWNKKISAEEITADKFYLEIMTDKRKPLPPNYSAEMPHEIIKDLGFDLNIRRIKTHNSRLVIKELWPYSIKPSYLNFTNVTADIYNVSTLSAYQSIKYPVVINASGNIADKGMITVKLNVPLLTDKVMFDYKGSLGKMEAAALNPHMEVADLTKIKSGQVENAEFSVKAEGDTARVNIIPIYNNIEIENLAEDGDEGLQEGLATFIANNIALRKSNPDDEGKIKSGNVIYRLKKTDAFLDYIWLSVKKGLGEVVGF